MIEPDCEYGYSRAALVELFGWRFEEFGEWMTGQTMMLCPEHGPVAYRSDVERFIAGLPVID